MARVLRGRAPEALGPRLALLCPRLAPRTVRPRGVALVEFDAPVGSLDDLAQTFVASESWTTRFREVLGDRPVLAHHLPAARVAEALGLPFLVMMHSLWPAVRARWTGEAPGPRAEASASLLATAAAVLVGTRAERNALLATAPPGVDDLERRIHVVGLGISPFLARLARRGRLERRRAAWRRRLLPGAAPEDVVLYTVGRWVPYKRTLDLVEAFVRVAACRSRLRLLLVGSPTDADFAARVHSAVAAAPGDVADRIHLVGPQRLEAASLSGDVLVHLSRVESWGRSLDEAAVMGRPAVIASSPALTERLGRPETRDDPSQGPRWIDEDTDDALDAALCFAADDADWRRAAGAAAAARADGQRWDGPATEVLRVWDQVEARHRGTRSFAPLPPAGGADSGPCASS